MTEIVIGIILILIVLAFYGLWGMIYGKSIEKLYNYMDEKYGQFYSVILAGVIVLFTLFSVVVW